MTDQGVGSDSNNYEVVFPNSVDKLKPTITKSKIEEFNRPINLSKALKFFERNFSDELEVFSKLGIALDSGKSKFYDPFRKLVIEDDFTNIGEHCLAVATCTLMLTRFLEKERKIDAVSANEAIRRALLHDAIKPWEIFLARALRDNVISKEKYYDEAVFLSVVDVLITLGISPEIANRLVTDYGSETDVRECFPFFLREAHNGKINLKSGSMPKKIVHLADNMTCSTMPSLESPSKHYFLTTWERMVAADADARYPWALKAGIAVNAKAEIFHTSDRLSLEKDSRALFHIHDALIALSSAIATEFCPKEKDPDLAIKIAVLAQMEDFSAYSTHGC